MGKIKGQAEYLKFKEGKVLTVKQAVKAHCYACNGEEEGSSIDCQSYICPLYPFFLRWILRKRRKSSLERESGTLNHTKNIVEADVIPILKE